MATDRKLEAEFKAKAAPIPEMTIAKSLEIKSKAEVTLQPGFYCCSLIANRFLIYCNSSLDGIIVDMNHSPEQYDLKPLKIDAKTIHDIGNNQFIANQCDGKWVRIYQIKEDPTPKKSQRRLFFEPKQTIHAPRYSASNSPCLYIPLGRGGAYTITKICDVSPNKKLALVEYTFDLTNESRQIALLNLETKEFRSICSGEFRTRRNCVRFLSDTTVGVSFPGPYCPAKSKSREHKTRPAYLPAHLILYQIDDEKHLRTLAKIDGNNLPGLDKDTITDFGWSAGGNYFYLIMNYRFLRVFSGKEDFQCKFRADNCNNQAQWTLENDVETLTFISMEGKLVQVDPANPPADLTKLNEDAKRFSSLQCFFSDRNQRVRVACHHLTKFDPVNTSIFEVRRTNPEIKAEMKKVLGDDFHRDALGMIYDYSPLVSLPTSSVFRGEQQRMHNLEREENLAKLAKHCAKAEKAFHRENTPHPPRGARHLLPQGEKGLEERAEKKSSGPDFKHRPGMGRSLHSQ